MGVPSSVQGQWEAPSWLLVVRGATLEYVWRIPVVVGTLLNAVNLGPALQEGFSLRLAVTAVVNYLVPYVVSSLGFLRSQRHIEATTAGATR